MIIGISGPYGSGKSESVRYLAARSFYALSLSDVIRQKLQEEGQPETREKMIRTGNALREQEGDDALVRRLVARMSRDRNYVIDSIRHPAEVNALRSLGQRFTLIWVDANPETRLERIRGRNRCGDPGSIEALECYEASEAGATPHGQQLDRVRELADRTIWNNGGVAALQEQIQAILQETLHFERPSWDEYFMSIARVVATRSNCVKRNVAAVITVDRRIISTGYNGTPRGVTNCNEGGCTRCNTFAPSGVDLGECLCSHAEENAITQAAYHGVRVAGGSIYSTFCPCLICTKMIVNAGLKEVVFHTDYPLGSTSKRLLEEGGVRVRQLTEQE